MPPPLVLYGSSGYAQVIDCHARQSYGKPLYEVVAYIDDFCGGTDLTINGIPIISFERWQTQYRNIACIITTGNPKARMMLTERVSQNSGNFGTIYAPSSSISPDITVGQGSFISPHGYIGSCSSIGEHVHIMPSGCIGHDVTIEDFVTICPSVSISGYVTVGRGVFLGVNSCVVNGSSDKPLVIGAGATIYAGAVVTKSVPPNTVVAGNPARPLRKFLKDR